MADPTNAEIAEALDELGDLYELDGAVIYRIVSSRNAAKAIRDATVSVTALAREGRATELAGVGSIIQEKVLALADDGEIPAAVKLRAKFPPGLLELTHLSGLGPKRARRLYEEARDRLARRAPRGSDVTPDQGAQGIRSESRANAVDGRRKPPARAPPRPGRTAAGRGSCSIGRC